MSFEDLCSIYPRVERRKVAEAAFHHALTKTNEGTLLAAVRWQRDWLMKDGIRYCPDLVAWLQEERWLAKIDRPVGEPDEFGYYPGQFEKRPLTDEEQAAADEHARWVRSYIEGLVDAEEQEAP